LQRQARPHSRRRLRLSGQPARPGRILGRRALMAPMAGRAQMAAPPPRLAHGSPDTALLGITPVPRSRIAGITVTVVNIPYEAPTITSSLYARPGISRTLVRLRTDDGLEGLGEGMGGDALEGLGEGRGG